MAETVETIHAWATETFGRPKRNAVIGKTMEEILELQRALVAWFEAEDEMRDLRIDRIGRHDTSSEIQRARDEHQKALLNQEKKLKAVRKELGDCFVMLSNCFEGKEAMSFPYCVGGSRGLGISAGRRSGWIQGLGDIIQAFSNFLTGVQRWEDIEDWLHATWCHLVWLAVGIGIDVQEVVDEVMVINRARQWRVDGDGTGKHIG